MNDFALGMAGGFATVVAVATIVGNFYFPMFA